MCVLLLSDVSVVSLHVSHIMEVKQDVLSRLDWVMSLILASWCVVDAQMLLKLRLFIKDCEVFTQSIVVFGFSGLCQTWDRFLGVQVPILLFCGCLLLLWHNTFLQSMPQWFPEAYRHEEIWVSSVSCGTSCKANGRKRVSLTCQTSSNWWRICPRLWSMSKCPNFLKPWSGYLN